MIWKERRWREADDLLSCFSENWKLFFFFSFFFEEKGKGNGEFWKFDVIKIRLILLKIIVALKNKSINFVNKIWGKFIRWIEIDYSIK